MVTDVLIAVGHHGAPTVPAALADNVHFGCQESVRGTDNRPDVEVVLPVLDRYMETVTALIQIGHDRLDRPIPILIGDIARISVTQQFTVVPRIVRPIALPWSDADSNLRLAHVTANSDR